MKLVELKDSEFSEFEQKQSCGNFFQSAERAVLRRQMGWKVYLLGVEEKEIEAGALLMERDGVGLVQLGPVMDYQDVKVLEFFLKEVVKFADERKMMALELFPPALLSRRDVHGEPLFEYDQEKVFEAFSRQGFKYMGRTVELENKANRWMVVKDLGEFKDMAEVRASFKKNVRNKLRKVSPELEVYELKEKREIPLLVRVVDDSNAKNKVVSRKLKYYEQMWDAWGDKIRFVLARRKEDHAVVAGRVLICHPNEVVSFISGTAKEYKRLNGMTFLQDWLLEDCLGRGIKRANFYGIDGDFSGKNPLLEFKSGFGVEIEEYIGGFRKVLRPVEYRAAQMKLGALGALRDIKHKAERFRK